MSLEIIEVHEFEKSTYQFTKEGILVIHVHDGSAIELIDAKIEFNYLKNKKDVLPIKILVHPGKETTISKEVREFINLPESLALVQCQAIIVDNLAHKIIASFMMKLYGKKNKLKVFSKEREAIDWLKGQ